MSQITSIIKEIESVIIRFTGDSGDGMQLTGSLFTDASALAGNDISTFPDYPAEIRAPAGTLAGVSGFQVNLSSTDIYTPGDSPDVLVAMNPAALAANLSDLKPGGVVIVNSDAFTENNLKKAHYTSDPTEDGSLDRYRLYKVPISALNRQALESLEGLSKKEIDRTKNFFALGMAFWMYDRRFDNLIDHIKAKFQLPVQEANIRAFKAGYNYGETTEAFQIRYRIAPAKLPAGVYRKITGNEAAAIGLVTAANRAGKTLFCGSYPITPASEILHYLAALRHFDVRTFQAEDEIAAMGSTIGAAFGGAFAVTTTSGPGLALKSEALNLALVLELPMVLINVQRGGPSTGLPTKTEQSDLLMSFFGRNGDSPLPIVAACSPGDCFTMALEAFRLAVRAMSPVVLLTDGYIANSSEPWRIPNPDLIAPIIVDHPTNPEGFQPLERDPESLARPWIIPGTRGLEHRIGGLAKAPLTGNVSYIPEHHQEMVDTLAEKVARLARVIPEQDVLGPASGDLLVVGWGGTYGAIRTAVLQAQREGLSVAHAQVRYLNPFPSNFGELMKRYKTVLVPELNRGQLAFLIRGQFGLHVESLTKVQGKSFKISEVHAKIQEILKGGCQ